MNMTCIRLSLLLLGLTASSVFAAPKVTIATDDVIIGESVDIPITLETDGDIAVFNFDFTFDNNEFTATTHCVPRLDNSTGDPFAATQIVCGIVGGNTITVVAVPPALVPSPTINAGPQDLGFITFQSMGDTPVGAYPLPLGTQTFATPDQTPVPAVGSVDGLINVIDGPQPDWSSVPDSATGINFGNKVVETGQYVLPLTVTNAGAADSTLTGTCQVSGSTVFDIVGDPTLGAGLAMGASDDIDVECNTQGATLMLHQGTLSCEHNGDGTTETSITDYALSCNITEGPQPAFSGTPNGLDTMSVPKEGDLPEPSGTLSVQNVGDTTTLLTGSCSVSGGDAGKFSMINGSFTDLAAQEDQGPTHVVTVSCDTSAEGDYTSTLACIYEAAGSPTNYPLSCTVGPPGDAVFGSTIAPAVGAEINIDLTPGGVVIDTVVAPIPLNISNDALPNDNNRDLPFDCSYSGSIEISVGNMSGSPLMPGTSAGGVSFSCDTSAVGTFSGTYTCTYSEDGGATDKMDDWNVGCEVRDPESDVDPSPTPGELRLINVAPGGTGQTSVSFSEVLDEGEPGSLLSCTLVNNTAFTIVSSTAYPIEIPSGGPPVVVEIEGTDTGTPADNTATLECFYADSGGSERPASWPLLITVQVFGIPTMGAWGQILMILSLLGIGMVGFRRFS